MWCNPLFCGHGPLLSAEGLPGGAHARRDRRALDDARASRPVPEGAAALPGLPDLACRRRAEHAVGPVEGHGGPWPHRAQALQRASAAPRVSPYGKRKKPRADPQGTSRLGENERAMNVRAAVAHKAGAPLTI